MLTDTNLDSGGKICGLKCFLCVFGEGRAGRAPTADSPAPFPSIEAIRGQQLSQGGPEAPQAFLKVPTPGEKAVAVVSPLHPPLSLPPQQKCPSGGVLPPLQPPGSLFLSLLSVPGWMKPGAVFCEAVDAKRNSWGSVGGG